MARKVRRSKAKRECYIDGKRARRKDGVNMKNASHYQH